MSDLKTLMAENTALLHAMQSGVAYSIEYGLNKEDTEPKHLRVGINNALISTGALVDLLISKGVISQEEWVEAYNACLRKEVESYELALSVHLKTRVKLG